MNTKKQAVNLYWSSLNTLLAGWIRGQSHSVTGDCHETLSPKKKKMMLKLEEEQTEKCRRKIEEDKTVNNWKKMEDERQLTSSTPVPRDGNEKTREQKMKETPWR